MTAEEVIRGLRAAVGARNDVELAKALGIERSTIAQWKRRGAVPGKYAYLVNPDNQPAPLARMFNAMRHHLLGRAENHYFLRAALAFMPKELPTPEGVSLPILGEVREAQLLLLMNLAQIATQVHLGKRYCETADDYIALIAVMEKEEGEVIAEVLAGDEGLTRFLNQFPNPPA